MGLQMKVTKILLIAGIASIMLSTTAFATEVEVETEIETESQMEVIQTLADIFETIFIENQIQENQESQVQEVREEEPKNKTGMVTVDILNVRRGPSTETEKLGALSLGTRIEILSEVEDWYEINYESNTAYVSAEYVRIIDILTYSQNPGMEIVDYAKAYLGTPYAYGGSSPKGFDCSGFVQYVMKNFGVEMPRTSTEQYSIGVRVDKSDLMPGDLVYFKYSPSSYRLSHVGIYVGDGNFIHSPVPGQSVKISPLNTGYFSYYYYGATRVLY